MLITLIGKKTGEFNGKPYYSLYFIKDIEKDGQGAEPLTMYSYGRTKTSRPCTKDVYDKIKVGDKIELDYVLVNPIGKIIDIRR